MRNKILLTILFGLIILQGVLYYQKPVVTDHPEFISVSDNVNSMYFGTIPNNSSINVDIGITVSKITMEWSDNGN